MHVKALCQVLKHSNAWKGEGTISMKKSVALPPCCDTIQNSDTFCLLRVTTRVAMSSQHRFSPKKGLQIMQPLHLFFRAWIFVHVCVLVLTALPDNAVVVRQLSQWTRHAPSTSHSAKSDNSIMFSTVNLTSTVPSILSPPEEIVQQQRKRLVRTRRTYPLWTLPFFPLLFWIFYLPISCLSLGYSCFGACDPHECSLNSEGVRLSWWL